MQYTESGSIITDAFNAGQQPTSFCQKSIHKSLTRFPEMIGYFFDFPKDAYGGERAV